MAPLCGRHGSIGSVGGIGRRPWPIGSWWFAGLQPVFLWDNGITMENPLKGLSNQGLLGGFGLSGWFDWFDWQSSEVAEVGNIFAYDIIEGYVMITNDIRRRKEYIHKHTLEYIYIYIYLYSIYMYIYIHKYEIQYIYIYNCIHIVYKIYMDTCIYIYILDTKTVFSRCYFPRLKPRSQGDAAEPRRRTVRWPPGPNPADWKKRLPSCNVNGDLWDFNMVWWWFNGDLMAG